MSTITVTEADFQQRILDWCGYRRLKFFHDNDSRRNKAGFPDLVIVGPRGVLFRELKTDTGRVSPEQSDWLADLTRAGADADVWRPADWARIQRELEAIR